MTIVGYFAVWALVHSVLASQRVKLWFRQTTGPSAFRWYRLLFVLFAVLTLAPLLALLVLLPDHLLYVVLTPWQYALLALQGIAFLALLVSVYQAGMGHFLGLAQLVADARAAAGTLQVRGFYRYVRHPLYLFSAVLIWLTPRMTLNLAALYASMTIYFVIGSYHEEALLEDEYGEAYRAYSAAVPRFLPRLRGRCPIAP